MKNLRKVLALVLAFACTFTMFASAVVFEDVPAGSEFSEAITMLSDLKIIQGKDDGKYHPEDTITRAEACALIARMLTGDPNVNQYVGAANFSDVQKGSWKDSAIGYCVTNGIAVGVGNGKFEPDRPITDAEFVTLLVRAMGYETPGMSYPYGHMSAAQANGLLDGTSMQVGTDALRGEDAQALYNAMFADYAKGAKTINTTHGSTIETYPTIAESVWGLSRAAIGTYSEDKDSNSDAQLKNCKSHTWVIAGPSKDKEDAFLAYAIKDDSKDLFNVGDANDLENAKKASYDVFEFKYDGDISGLIGYRVELWGEGTHGSPTWEKTKENGKYVYSDDWKVKAIKTVKGQTFYDYNASMADSKSDNGEIVLEDKTLGLGQAADNAKNIQQADVNADLSVYLHDSYHQEKANGKMSDKDVEKALNIRDGAQYKLMDWDSDGTIDWIVVDEANYYRVESATSKRVVVNSMKDDKNKGESWETEKDSMKDTWKIGEDNDLSKDVVINYEVPEGLEEGDIVEVTYKFDGKANKIKATATVVEANSKSLDKVSTKGGLELTFDDEVIYVAQNTELGNVIVPANPSAYKDFNGEELGTDFDLYQNRNGFIVYSDYTTERAAYMMVLDTADGADTVGKRNLVKMDILTGDNKHLKDVELAENARVTAGYNSSKRTIDESVVVGNVYKYWTNEDGQITRMDALITPKSQGAVELDSYKYDASADRITDVTGNKYYASLEDADIIFATKSWRGNISTGTETNIGYIHADQTNVPTGKQYYVDVNDVLAVKQKDIPDIGGNAETQTAKLDNDGGLANRQPTWLSNAQTYNAEFIAGTDKNGDASAAVLGVNNFNKFNAGSTKIGLVTDVSYSNSADGKYVSITASFGGEANKTIESTKKVNVDDIVSIYDANAQRKVAVGSLDSNYNIGMFNNTSLAKYLEKSGAYAEIQTNADGALTGVTFLNSKSSTADDHGTIYGQYFTVTRNVVTDVKDKSMTYLRNDVVSSDENTNRQDQVLYAADNKLYTVDSLTARNKAFADDATFYSIDGRPTRTDDNYNETRMAITGGFYRAPEVEVIDKASIGYAKPDADNNKDTYYVSDIAIKNNGDVAAVFSYDKGMDEVPAGNIIRFQDAGSTNFKVKAGEFINLKMVDAKGQNNKNAVDSFKVYSADGKEVTTGFTFNETNDVDVTLTVDAGVAPGTYTIKAANGSTVYAGGVDIKVESATQVTVEAVGMAYYDAGTWKIVNSVKPVGNDKIAVRAGKTAGSNKGDGINGLKKENFKVTLGGGIPANVIGIDPAGDGYYYLTLDQNLSNYNQQDLTVSIVSNGLFIAGANATETQKIDTSATAPSEDPVKAVQSVGYVSYENGVAVETTAPILSEDGKKFSVSVEAVSTYASTGVDKLVAGDFAITTTDGTPVTVIDAVKVGDDAANNKSFYELTVDTSLTDKTFSVSAVTSANTPEGEKPSAPSASPVVEETVALDSSWKVEGSYSELQAITGGVETSNFWTGTSFYYVPLDTLGLTDSDSSARIDQINEVFDGENWVSVPTTGYKLDCTVNEDIPVTGGQKADGLFFSVKKGTSGTVQFVVKKNGTDVSKVVNVTYTDADSQKSNVPAITIDANASHVAKASATELAGIFGDNNFAGLDTENLVILQFTAEELGLPNSVTVSSAGKIIYQENPVFTEQALWPGNDGVMDYDAGVKAKCSFDQKMGGSDEYYFYVPVKKNGGATTINLKVYEDEGTGSSNATRNDQTKPASTVTINVSDSIAEESSVTE